MKTELKQLIEKAILEAKKNQAWPDFELPEIVVDYPKQENFGDYTTNIAMILAKKVGKSPMETAEKIKNELCHSGLDPESKEIPESSSGQALNQVQDDTCKEFEKIEVVAPGYINFYLAKKYLQNIVAEVNKEKENFGSSKIGNGVKINNEFISANPTGPLHLGNGRGGFYGDSISKVLRKSGFEVVNEYYVNDAGEQIVKLGHSVLKDEEAVYGGEYVDSLHEKFSGESDAKTVGQKAAGLILEEIIKKTTSEKMQIGFDSWISERSLYDESFVKKAIATLKEKNLTYEKDGALWLRTTDFGDDKDRVLVKSDGQKTYFASDCGYLLNKKQRSFSKVIEIWGADHHGYIDRFRAAAEALGFEKGNIKFIIVQLVRLVKNGKEVRMSKRAGNVVYIDDLIEMVGHDVTRFFFLMYSPDTHMNFDLGLAEERSEKNPVFYVQYAHARIASILRKAEQEITNYKLQITKTGLNPLTHEKELSLMRELNKFPELVSEISQTYEVHKLPHFAIRLADKFHSFYNECQVIDKNNLELSQARLSLVNAVKTVLAETLRLIGVNAPERM